ncbi:hypothetical protein CBOM_02318 [Ceraceosorus bombacis]|uniref:Uncharacterized protein n=1 Tax=Ceraceosorus bombacis TaxID=401625 RepID=A0A0N7L9Q9_9BASI|nr:hypothetical protein CBOM_02318 [Ceraceosorus bombacis]
MTTSFSRQCKPLNVTWTPESDGYPYTVSIVATGFGAQTFSVDSDYQPGASQLTFQYVVPPPTGLFNSYIVALTDSKGQGTTSQVMSIDTRNTTSDCPAYTSSNSFTWAGDNTSGGSPALRYQCGNVRFYPVDQRGTSPFSITMFPLGGLPVTINVPASQTMNTSFFIAPNVTVPFESGTRFVTMLSDAQGAGSGGGSPVYNVLPSSDTSCLQRRQPNQLSGRAVPNGAIPASFQNLAGALTADEANAGSGNDGNGGGGGGGTNVGGLVGGVIGAVIAVAIVVAALVAFFLYRRRQKAKREEARKEQPQFVDLDGDEDGQLSPAALAARRGRHDAGVSQSYAVSPFTYQSTAQHSPGLGGEHDLYRDEPLSAPGRPQSVASNALRGHSGAGLRYPPSSPGPLSSSGYTDAGRTGGISSTVGGSEYGGDFASATSHGPGSVAAGDSYRLSARNLAEPGTGDVPPLPRKGALPEDTNAPSSSRFVQHQDAGPAPVPDSDEEDAMEELPPSYGGWANRPAPANQAPPS